MKHTEKPVATIEALSMVNAMGASAADFQAAFADPDVSPLVESQAFLQDAQPATVGMIHHELAAPCESLVEFHSRYISVLNHLYLQIRDQIGSAIEHVGAHRIGVVLGSSTSGILETESAFRKRDNHGNFPASFRYAHQEIGSGSSYLSRLLGTQGPSYTISTACSSSAKVFQSASLLLKLGICDYVITGGVDTLCSMTVQGFQSLQLLSDGRSNPFSKNRNGLNIGEGGALFLLALNGRGVRVLGVGESSDAHHMSAPHPLGRGAREAIVRALKASEVPSSRVQYVNLHGTGTKLNDAMESHAISGLFDSTVRCSSTKPFTGHLLGASGATEVGFCALSLSGGAGEALLPPHCWDRELDREIPALRFVEKGERVRLHPDDVFVSTSFAFGGSNCAVVLAAPQGCSPQAYCG